MQPLKYTYDKLSDSSVEKLLEISSRMKNTDADLNAKVSEHTDQHDTLDSPKLSRSRPDLFLLLQENHSTDPILSQLWTEVTTVPSWVSWPQIARGQAVFYRYGGANLTGLAFQSLLGGLGGWRVVEVLSRTGGFNTKVALRRLYETTQHILQVTRSLEGIQPGGDGWIATVRVRMLHSQVRQRILALARTNPDYFDVQAWGVPASDLDSIATIATFSSTLLWQSLPRQGIFVTAAEADDYVALWRYVGYLLGTPVEGFFDSAGAARRTLESLFLYEIVPSETSRVLAHNMMQAMSRVPPLYASEDMLAAMARWLNGHELCDALGVLRPSGYYYALMVGQCLFFMATSYTTWIFPAWDARKQRLFKKRFWAMIVESKSGLGNKEALFEFKWIPRVGKLTGRQQSDVNAVMVKGIESRNLRTVVFGAFVLLLTMWIIWRSLSSILRYLW